MDNTKIGEVVLEVKNLRKYFYSGLVFKKQTNVAKAVDNVSFQIHKGETLGLVGESGCGKSTLGRTILGLYKPIEGAVRFKDQELTKLRADELRFLYRKMQMIFQDPYSSLNPKMKVKAILNEPFVIHNLYDKQTRVEKIKDLIHMVGLEEDFLNRYPHEFSGGQRQRIGIARALALNPEFIVCDEAVSALDVSIQAQTINLLRELQKRLDLSYLFISHNLAVVKHISDRVAVMYLGQIV
jgi:ABC-type oligopeptide transport system ATPase subunit